MSHSTIRGCRPAGRVPPVGGDSLRLVWVTWPPLLHLLCVWTPGTAASPWPLQAVSYTTPSHHSLRSGIGQAFPTWSRLGDCTGKRGCQCLEVPVWAGNQGQAPWLHLFFLLYSLGGKKEVTGNSQEFYAKDRGRAHLFLGGGADKVSYIQVVLEFAIYLRMTLNF